MDRIDEQTALDVAELFSALGDASRVRIIAALSGEEQNVGELAQQVSLTQSAVSHHLRNLRQLRLVQSRREGRHVYYRLDDDHVGELFRCGLEHVRLG